MFGLLRAGRAPTKPAPVVPTAKPFPFDAKEDRDVNRAAVYAVRRGSKLEIQSKIPYVLFYFEAIPPRGLEQSTKLLSPGQRFIFPDRHGRIEYQAMAFQKQGLLVRYHNEFNMGTPRNGKSPNTSGSFLIRFKNSPTQAPKPPKL